MKTLHEPKLQQNAHYLFIFFLFQLERLITKVSFIFHRRDIVFLHFLVENSPPDFLAITNVELFFRQEE